MVISTNDLDQPHTVLRSMNCLHHKFPVLVIDVSTNLIDITIILQYSGFVFMQRLCLVYSSTTLCSIHPLRQNVSNVGFNVVTLLTQHLNLIEIWKGS